MMDCNKGIKNKNMSRRDFLGAAAAVSAFTIVPRCVLGGAGNTPPSEKLNIAGIGVGGQGAWDWSSSKARISSRSATLTKPCGRDF